MPSPGGIYTSPYPSGWKDGPGGGTPLDAVAINELDTGIKGALQAPTSPNDGDLPIWDASANGGLGGWNATSNKLISRSQLAALNIVDSDISAGAGIQISKLNGFPNSNLYYLRGDGTWTTPTAAAITNAADKSSASVQVFAGGVSTGPTARGFTVAGIIIFSSTGQMYLVGSAATDLLFVSETGDTTARVAMRTDGSVNWSAGSGSQDTSVARGGANNTAGVLKVSNTIRTVGAVALTYGTTVTPDASKGDFFELVVTNTTAFTLANPTNPPGSAEAQWMTIEILNSSGGAMGAVTLGTAYKGLSSISGITNGNHANFTFRWNGSAWVYIGGFEPGEIY